MKLYATTTSERGKPATKGGNEYIDIIITDVNRKELYNISIIPDPQGHIVIWHHGKYAMMQKKHGGGYYIKYEEIMETYNKLKNK